MEDHYEVLNLPRFATAEEVRKSYRKLLLKYHPDKNKSDGAEERFKQIHESYKILADSVQKSTYDLKLKTYSRTSTTTTTFTRTSNFSTSTTTTTTRASFNPKSSTGFQSPNLQHNNSYKTRNFDHLFTKTNVKESPKSKFHYSNFQKSYNNVPPMAAQPRPFKDNPYQTRTTSKEDQDETKSEKHNGEDQNKDQDKHKDMNDDDSHSKQDNMAHKSTTSTSNVPDDSPYRGEGRQGDPIILDGLEEGDNNSNSADQSSDQDIFVDAQSVEEFPASSNASPRVPAQSYMNPSPRLMSDRSKRRGPGFGYGSGKRVKISLSPLSNKGPSGRVNRTSIEEQEEVEIVEEGGSLPNFDEIRNLPPFTRNYNDINLDSVDEILSNLDGEETRPIKKLRTMNSAASSPTLRFENGKRFKRDVLEFEKLAHEPVNSFAKKFGRVPPALNQTEFVNSHPSFHCRLPINYDSSKTIHQISIRDLLETQFDLLSPLVPSLEHGLRSLTDFKQLLSEFYFYEEQFKTYQTSYLSYMKIRTELDVFQLKNVLGYNKGTENLDLPSDKLVNLSNLQLYTQVMANDLEITENYNRIVQEHRRSLALFLETCSKFNETNEALKYGL